MTAYTHTNDHALFSLMQAGDKAAFTELYNRYWDKLLVVAGKRLNNLFMAEEIVQDIFSNIWMRRQDINISSSVAAYLAAAVKYKVMDARVKMSNASSYLAYASQQSQADDSTRKWLQFEELRKDLEKLVAALPAQTRRTYQLMKVEGLSIKETAKEMNISPKAVQHNISRALKSLRNSLKYRLFHLFCSFSTFFYLF